MKEEAKNVKQDIEIAVLAKEVEHMGENLNSFKESIGERMQSLTEVIKGFIEIANKKVDRDIYLEDKRQLGIQLARMEDDIKQNTDFRKTYVATKNGQETERKTIWGFSQGSISFIISLLTLVTLGVTVIGIFANK